MWPFNLFKRKPKTEDIPVPIEREVLPTESIYVLNFPFTPGKPTASIHYPANGYSGSRYDYPNTSHRDSSDDDFSSVALLTATLGSNTFTSSPDETYQGDCKAPDNDFQGFDGGSSGGAGASDSWDDEPDQSGQDYSSSDYSSSND